MDVGEQIDKFSNNMVVMTMDAMIRVAQLAVDNNMDVVKTLEEFKNNALKEEHE